MWFWAWEIGFRCNPGRAMIVYRSKVSSLQTTLEQSHPFQSILAPGASYGRVRSDSPKAVRVSGTTSASELEDIDALVRMYRAKILRFVTFSTGDPDLAETIAQDCLLKAYRARESFRGDASVQTWLTSIAVNLIRDHQRTRKFKFWRQARATAVDVSDVASFVAAEGSTQEAQLIAKQQVARLSEVLEGLSFNQRTVFVMRFTDEMELQQISGALGMPINTVKTHLHRAVKAVRTELGARR